MIRKHCLWFAAMLLLSACGGGGGSSDQTPIDDNNTPDPPSNAYIWEEASPESVGMDSNLISAAFDSAFADGTYTQAALVIKDNKLVYERYRGILAGEISTVVNSLGVDAESVAERYGTRDRYNLASSWSTGKSFVSVLIAIAIEQGHIQSLQQHASDFIDEWADDNRSRISIRNLLDMRSGLALVCLNNATGQLGTCSDTGGGSGGNLVFSDNQMTACINRPMAQTGAVQPWYGGVYESGYWVYSNCDTMVLGEILFRATGQDLQSYADINLFSKIGMEAYWWRDFDSTAQVDGNYLAYCCIDATPRDFAKFGQLLMNNGRWDGSQIVPSEYIDLIKNIVVDSVVAEQYGGLMSYGLKFWTLFPQQQQDGTVYPPANKIYSTIGFDGQYIMMDFENNLIVVRNSIYYPSLGLTDERRMKINLGDLEKTNHIFTLPAGVGMQTGSSFNVGALLYGVTQSIYALSQ